MTVYESKNEFIRPVILAVHAGERAKRAVDRAPTRHRGYDTKVQRKTACTRQTNGQSTHSVQFDA